MTAHVVSAFDLKQVVDESQNVSAELAMGSSSAIWRRPGGLARAPRYLTG